MKICVHWNPIYTWKDSHIQRVLNPGPLDQEEVRNLSNQILITYRLAKLTTCRAITKHKKLVMAAIT